MEIANGDGFNNNVTAPTKIESPVVVFGYMTWDCKGVRRRSTKKDCIDVRMRSVMRKVLRAVADSTSPAFAGVDRSRVGAGDGCGLNAAARVCLKDDVEASDEPSWDPGWSPC